MATPGQSADNFGVLCGLYVSTSDHNTEHFVLSKG